MKTCSFDCIYCQLGAEGRRVGERQPFYTVEEILNDVSGALKAGPTPDVLTLAGSGEPTLYTELGPLLDGLRALAPAIPTLLITNSSLLFLEAVRQAVRKVDILAPSLDAGDEATYKAVNRPLPGFSYEKMFEGLRRATHEHPGEVHLEVMLIDGVNDDEESLRAIANRLKRLRFDRIDINTPVRPPMPERGAVPCDEQVLKRAIELFGPKAHAIADFVKRAATGEKNHRRFSDTDKDIREMLLRRPCTVADMVASLAMSKDQIDASLARLTASGVVESRGEGKRAYYHVVGDNPTLTNKNNVSPLD